MSATSLYFVIIDFKETFTVLAELNMKQSLQTTGPIKKPIKFTE